MNALVTGGGGFLGSHLVRALLARGDSVTVLARGAYPELAAAGAKVLAGDVRRLDDVRRASEGIDIVFHTAAKAAAVGSASEFEAINVKGTENVVAACRSLGVRRLINTSSPSIVHDGRDIEGRDESIPMATHFLAHYPRTKALGETVVKAASSAELATVSLRPHLIWGPGDRHLLPRLVARARAGKLRQVGRRDPLTDTVFIDNCVDAHLLAADALGRRPELSGRSYFISDDAPIGIWTMARRMLDAVGGGVIGPPIPARAAYAAGAAFEFLYGALRLEGEPMVTRFAASELTHAQWFDISAAKRDLGYHAKVSIEEGLARLAHHAREQADATR